MNRNKPEIRLTNYILTGSDRKDVWAKAEEIVQEAKITQPECFNTDTAAIRYEMKYVPPFERNFDHLKKIQVDTSRAAPLFYEYNGYMIIDLTKYIGHETEDYFDTSLKFFSDMTDYWAYVFVINKEKLFCRTMIEKIANLFVDTHLVSLNCGFEKENKTELEKILYDCQTTTSEACKHVLQHILDHLILTEDQMAIMIRDLLNKYTSLTLRTVEFYLCTSINLIRAIIPADRYEKLVTAVKEKGNEHEQKTTI